jgi:hypothetical protein
MAISCLALLLCEYEYFSKLLHRQKFEDDVIIYNLIGDCKCD